VPCQSRFENLIDFELVLGSQGLEQPVGCRFPETLDTVVAHAQNSLLKPPDTVSTVRVDLDHELLVLL